MMLLIGALLTIVLFAGLGFIWPVLWLGILVGVILLVFHLLSSGLDGSTRGGRLKLRMLGAVRDYLDEVITAESQQAPQEDQATAERPAARFRRAGKSRRGSVMTPDKIEAAQELSDEGVGATAIAEEIGVSRSTVYRHVNTN